MKKKLRNPLVALVLLCYVLAPIDLIPDITPFFGLLDDIALVAAAYLKWRSKQQQSDSRTNKKKTQFSSEKSTSRLNRANPFLQTEDPYKILGIVGPASQAEIKKAFHKLAKIHHPDRVSANGEDKALAHEKMLRITRAYNRLRKVG